MKQPDKNKIYYNFSDIVSWTTVIVFEFEKIFHDLDVNKKYPAVKDVYMHQIIINLGKIFSKSANEPFRLLKFKEFCQKSIKDQIDNIFKCHKEIIEKLLINRKQISAHLDKDFLKLRFSQDRINELEHQFDHPNNFSKIKSKNKTLERYSPIDMNNDLSDIKNMLNQVTNIWKNAMNLDYSKNQ